MTDGSAVSAHDSRRGWRQFSINSELDELSTSPRQAGRTARTLVTDGPFSVVLVSLSAGTRIHEHKVSGPISIHCATPPRDLYTYVGFHTVHDGDCNP